MKLKETLMGPAQGERVCLEDFKHILLEILAYINGRAVLAPAGRPRQIAKSGMLGQQELV